MLLLGDPSTAKSQFSQVRFKDGAHNLMRLLRESLRHSKMRQGSSPPDASTEFAGQNEAYCCQTTALAAPGLPAARRQRCTVLSTYDN